MKMNFTAKTIGYTIASIFLLFYCIGVYWSLDVDSIDIHQEVTIAATTDNVAPVVGYTTTTTLIKVADTNQSDIDARQYNGLSFIVLGAGAIHGVQINGVFER